nr:hypothetical protein [Candidatus Sigynarchaeota archaeon]
MQGESIKNRDSVLEYPWLHDIENKVKDFYRDIDAAIQKISLLEDDWDGEGAGKFQDSVLSRVADFVKQLAIRAWQVKQRVINPPSILACPDGSVDIQWRTREFDLLVNVPGDINDPVTFSADDYRGNASRGTCDLKASNPILVSWLVEYS